MKSRTVQAALAILLVFSWRARAQEESAGARVRGRHLPVAGIPASEADTTSVSLPRLALVSLGPVVSLAGSYVWIKRSYWSEDATGFHFNGRNDFLYALNLDKAGHFYAGALVADLSAGGLRWAGLGRRDSYLYGALLSTLIQVTFEIKDGFAPTWGFSTWDVAAGTAGSLYAVGRHYSAILNATRLKLGYARRSDSYWKRQKHAMIVDDYVNQTFWLSLDVNALLPERLEAAWPDFLRIAVGVGIDETTDGVGGGRRELFLGLDYSLETIVGNPRSPLLKGLLHLFEYVKLPAPAVRLTPTGRVYGLYW